MDANIVKLQALDKRLATTNGKISALSEHIMSLKDLIEAERKYTS
jgi:hypothetical protein